VSWQLGIHHDLMVIAMGMETTTSISRGSFPSIDSAYG